MTTFSSLPQPAPLSPQPTPGPASAVPVAPPGRLTVALHRFWSGTHLPLSTTALIAATVALVLGALVTGSDPGLGLLLLWMALWSGAVPVLVRTRRWAELGLAVLSVATMSVVVWRDSGWVVAIAVLTAIGTAAVAAIGARSTLAVLAVPVFSALAAIRTVPWLVRGFSARGSSHTRQVWRTGVAIAVAVGLVAMFGSLFAAADPAFARLISHLSLTVSPGQVVIGVLCAFTSLTITHLVLAPPPGIAVAGPAARPVRLVEWLIPVLALSGLVWLFVIVQISGARALLTQGATTYADSAHQGFGQLLAATALTPIVVAIAARWAPRSTRSERLWTSAGVLAVCLGMLGVVAAALHRMDLYVDQYGLTELRVISGWWELVLGAVLLLGAIGAAVWRGRWLPRAMVVVLAVAAIGLAVWNPDAQIVRHNVAATNPAGLDVSYLRQLSADAVPAAAALPEPTRSELLRTLPTSAPLGWADWNWSRSRAVVLGEQVSPAHLAESTP